MRSAKEVLNDFECCNICVYESCDKCSYYNKTKDECMDCNDGLNSEVIELLEDYDNAYSKGSEDALELIKKVYDRDAKDIEECFGVAGGFYDVIRSFTIHEIKEKFEKWQWQKNIKVGDVVELTEVDAIGVVLDTNEDEIYLLDENGLVHTLDVEDVKKTNDSLEIHVNVLLGKLRDISYLMEISE